MFITNMFVCIIKCRVLFWQAANAKSAFVFEKTMKSIKTHSAAAYQYLMDIPLESWATFKFDTVVCCEENTSNFVESFNSTLGLDRNKPILSLLEGNYVQKKKKKLYNYTT